LFVIPVAAGVAHQYPFAVFVNTYPVVQLDGTSFTVTAQVLLFTERTPVLEISSLLIFIQLQAVYVQPQLGSGCNSRLPHTAKNTNWSIPLAVNVVLVLYGFVTLVPRVIV
jgi:hypothetical protein